MTQPALGPGGRPTSGPGDREAVATPGDILHELATPFDEAVDAALDRIRGHKVLDRLFYEASELGDFSLLWHLMGAVRALGSPEPLADLGRTATIIGVESLLVNQGVKRLFQRARPVHHDVRPHRLRTPMTSSFPSGHASAAFAAAVLLSEDSRAKPVFYALAVFVASSRVYVRIHHASDVVAGAALGYGLGRLAVRRWPRHTGRESRSPRPG